MASSSSFTSQPFLSHIGLLPRTTPTPTTTQHLLIPCSKTSSPPSTPPPPPSLTSTSIITPLLLLQTSNDNDNNVSSANKGATPKSSSSSSSSSTADSTDWVATSLTRRFGLGAGLAWVGFLAVGVVSEQVKTRFEVSQEQANTRDLEKEEEITLPNGIRYYEMRIGGGATPKRGDLVVLDLKGKVKDSDDDDVFVDTFGKNSRSLALIMGIRPYTRGMCEGIEEVLKTMKSGGKRRVIVPPKLGYCDNGADFGDHFNVSIPPCSTLEYIVEVHKVSIAPA